MKIIGQDNNGRLILDLEGEKFAISKAMPGESPVCVTNGAFTTTDFIPTNTSNSLFTHVPLEDINEYQKLEILDITNGIPKVPEPIEEDHNPVKRWEILDIR